MRAWPLPSQSRCRLYSLHVRRGSVESLQKELMDATNATTVSKITKTMDTIKGIKSVDTDGGTSRAEGAHLYIWALGAHSRAR